MQRPLLRFVLAGWILLGLAACQSTLEGQAAVGDLSSPIIFQVGTQRVTVEDFRNQVRTDIGPGIAQLQSQGQSQAEIEQLAINEGVRLAVFNNMVQEALLREVARRDGIGVNAELVDQALEAQLPLLVTAPGSLESSVDLRLSTSRQQLVLEVIARNTRADQANVRHILVATEAEADAVLAELAGGATFASLASRSIDTVSGANGGELGWAPRGEYVGPFEEAAFSLALNTPTKVQSEFGWHVIEVLERELNRSFDSFERLRGARNAQAFFETSFGPWYEELRRDAELSGALQIAPGFDPDSVPLPFDE